MSLMSAYRFNSGRRWWKRRQPLLRSIGFELPFIFGLGRGIGEQPKAIIEVSRKLALTRCGIHLLPTSVAIVILILNLGKSYLGKTLPGSIIDADINIALLQTAAKIQELSMVASVTVVVMHVLRSELTKGRGLPVGLLGAGFMYTSLSYFWSPEFWGSFYVKYDYRTRCRLYGILVFGGLVATFAGPSTAILLIPRQQLWSAGGTTIYLPGSSETWTPTVVATDSLMFPDYCQNMTATDRPECPSGGFGGLWSARRTINKLGRKAYIEGSAPTLTPWAYGPATINLPGNFGLLGSIQLQGNYRGYACETSAWGPRIPEAMYLAQLQKDWTDLAFALPYDPIRYGPSWTQYKYFDKVLDVAVFSRMPAVRVACLPAIETSFDRESVVVPAFSNGTCWAPNSTTSIRNYTRPQSEDIGSLGMTWVSAETVFDLKSAAMLLELPASKNATSRPVVGCSIDARWTKAYVATKYNFNTIAAFDAPVSNPITPGYSDFEPAIPSIASDRIQLTDKWLNSLTPFVQSMNVSGASQNATTLESLIIDLGFLDGLLSPTESSTEIWNRNTFGEVNRTVALEWWIALMVTDGLTRLGMSEVLSNSSANGTGALLNYDPVQNFRDQLFNNRSALVQPDSGATHERKVGIWIDGYSYQANTLTDYAAICLLLTFMIMALAHTIYSVWWSGQSSSSWDSLTELMMLMQNSRPATKIMPNTNAGIQDLKTFAKVGRVLATRPEGHGPSVNAQHCSTVELLFDEDTIFRRHYTDQTAETKIDRHPTSRSHRFPSVSSVRSNDALLEDIEISGSPPRKGILHAVNQDLVLASDTASASSLFPAPPVYERVKPDVKYS